MNRRLLSRIPEPVRLMAGGWRLLLVRFAPASDIRPADTPGGFVSGSDPLRIALIGEPAVTILGVLSHELGVAGFLARAHAELTGSGVHWSMTEVPSGRLREVGPAVGSVEHLPAADVVVLMLGLTDTRLRTPVTTWANQLRHAVEELRRRLSDDAWILLAETPLRCVAAESSRPFRIMELSHAESLNRCTRELATRYDKVVAVAEPAPSDVRNHESAHSRFSRIHKAWGERLACAIGETDRGPMPAAG